jgi:hypothetical protein
MIDPQLFHPTTLEEAVSVLVQNMDDAELAYVIEHGAEGQHFFAGMVIRNAWLWDNPKQGNIKILPEHFRQRFGLGHADDMSGLILLGVTCEVCARPFDPEAKAEEYRKFWRAQGVDPLTQEYLTEYPVQNNPPALTQPMPIKPTITDRIKTMWKRWT